MFKDLIDYKEVQEACSEYFGFSDVTFKRDFGPWKAGDKASVLWFEIDKEASAKETDNNGEIIKECKFKLEAIV